MACCHPSTTPPAKPPSFCRPLSMRQPHPKFTGIKWAGHFLLKNSIMRLIPFLYQFHPSINPSIYHPIPIQARLTPQGIHTVDTASESTAAIYSALSSTKLCDISMRKGECAGFSYHRAKASQPSTYVYACVHQSILSHYHKTGSQVLPAGLLFCHCLAQGPATKWSKAWQVPLAEEALRTEFWRMHDWQTADTYVALSVYTQTLQRCTDSVFALGR